MAKILPLLQITNELRTRLFSRYDLEMTADFLAGSLEKEVHAFHAQTGKRHRLCIPRERIDR
jgi:hypothetical protein